MLELRRTDIPCMAIGQAQMCVILVLALETSGGNYVRGYSYAHDRERWRSFSGESCSRAAGASTDPDHSYYTLIARSESRWKKKDSQTFYLKSLVYILFRCNRYIQIHCPDLTASLQLYDMLFLGPSRNIEVRKRTRSQLYKRKVCRSVNCTSWPQLLQLQLSPQMLMDRNLRQLHKKSQPLAQLPNYFYKTAVWQYDILMDWNQLHFKWNMPLNYWLLPLFMLTRWWINTDCIRNLNLSKAAVWHLSDAITDGEKPIA